MRMKEGEKEEEKEKQKNVKNRETDKKPNVFGTKKQSAAEKTENSATQERCAKITTKKTANWEKTV